MVLPANAGEGSPDPVGQGEHEVREGESVISIADKVGHLWETIWDDPENAELKRVRGSPHVLHQGDKIHVPDMEPKNEPVQEETLNSFKLLGQPIDVEFKLLKEGEPRAGERYTLTIEGRTEDGTVPEDGVITAKTYPADHRGELTVGEDEEETTYKLRLGELSPGHTREGAVARLRNLGLLGDDDSDEPYAAALRRFQAKHELEQTGALDDKTAHALVKEHGS